MATAVPHDMIARLRTPTARLLGRVMRLRISEPEQVRDERKLRGTSHNFWRRIVGSLGNEFSLSGQLTAGRSQALRKGNKATVATMLLG